MEGQLVVLIKGTDSLWRSDECRLQEGCQRFAGHTLHRLQDPRTYYPQALIVESPRAVTGHQYEASPQDDHHTADSCPQWVSSAQRMTAKQLKTSTLITDRLFKDLFYVPHPGFFYIRPQPNVV